MAKLTVAARDRISATKFAFPKQRKEPLENAAHVRNAVARFNQVKGVTEADRRAAWKRIQSAAKRYGVELEADSFRENSSRKQKNTKSKKSRS
jgi:cell division protein FtsX